MTSNTLPLILRTLVVAGLAGAFVLGIVAVVVANAPSSVDPLTVGDVDPVILTTHRVVRAMNGSLRLVRKTTCQHPR